MVAKRTYVSSMHRVHTAWIRYSINSGRRMGRYARQEANNAKHAHKKAQKPPQKWVWARETWPVLRGGRRRTLHRYSIAMSIGFEPPPFLALINCQCFETLANTYAVNKPGKGFEPVRSPDSHRIFHTPGVNTPGRCGNNYEPYEISLFPRLIVPFFSFFSGFLRNFYARVHGEWSSRFRELFLFSF